jgi:hypothetical protein
MLHGIRQETGVLGATQNPWRHRRSLLGRTAVEQLSGVGATTRKRVGPVPSIWDGRKRTTRSSRNSRLASYGGNSILNCSYALLKIGQALLMVAKTIVDLLFEFVDFGVQLLEHAEELADLVLVHGIRTVLMCL